MTGLLEQALRRVESLSPAEQDAIASQINETLDDEEAWARRRYKAAFVNKIDEALGEANETQSWLDDALDRISIY